MASVGTRISIRYARALLDAALDGQLHSVECRNHGAEVALETVPFRLNGIPGPGAGRYRRRVAM